METVTDGQVVEMNYTLTADDGQKLDSSEGAAPLAFIVGKRNIIPGLEKEVLGKSVGDKLQVKVAPEEAYGVRDDRMVQEVPKEQFGTDIANVQVGTQFQLQDQNGQMLIATAVEISEETVTLDANHPLAGENLNFDIEIVSIRAATQEELEHGHVHQGEEDCCEKGTCS